MIHGIYIFKRHAVKGVGDAAVGGHAVGVGVAAGGSRSGS